MSQNGQNSNRKYKRDFRVAHCRVYFGHNLKGLHNIGQQHDINSEIISQ